MCNKTKYNFIKLELSTPETTTCTVTRLNAGNLRGSNIIITV